MEEYFTLIGTYGFPIFMCLWFMFRTEKVIARNSEALEHLSDNIKQINIKK